MESLQCCGIEQVFDDNLAATEVKRHRMRGPRKTTQVLIDYLAAQGLAGATVLDVGGGVGALHQALLAAGAGRATDVDASAAYLRAAKSEALRKGVLERISFLHGDFVALAPTIDAADIVTLDRVICCYDDAESLVALSAARARRYYALVYPWDSPLARAFSVLLNGMRRLQRTFYRSYIHPRARVEDILRANGLERQFLRRAGLWQVAVYARVRPPGSSSPLSSPA
ncbi:MAG TPA: class I SAM-dependent methyltransferase [Spirochaetia bacterium]|nr:class I SAM-dependent methyltransferase [Spirochaetia bacterium]